MAMVLPQIQLQLSPSSKLPPPSSQNPKFLNLKLENPPSLMNPNPSSNPGLLFREKVFYLEHDLRIDSYRALSLNPALRSAPLSAVHSAVNFLSSYRISPVDSARIFQMYPHLLTCDPNSDLLPVINFLLGPVAVPFHHLRKAVVRCSRLLVSSVPDQLQPTLYFLRRLGFTGAHRITANTTLLLVSDVEQTLIPKLDYIQSLGFSYRETVRMVLRSPGLLTFSIENNFKHKVEFLLEEIGRDVRELKDFPQYFSFILDGKIKPRHRALVESRLEKGLANMLKVSDGEFWVRLLEMRLKASKEKEGGP